jgi:hypothetical protein
VPSPIVAAKRGGQAGQLFPIKARHLGVKKRRRLFRVGELNLELRFVYGS